MMRLVSETGSKRWSVCTSSLSFFWCSLMKCHLTQGDPLREGCDVRQYISISCFFLVRCMEETCNWPRNLGLVLPSPTWLAAPHSCLSGVFSEQKSLTVPLLSYRCMFKTCYQSFKITTAGFPKQTCKSLNSVKNSCGCSCKILQVILSVTPAPNQGFIGHGVATTPRCRYANAQRRRWQCFSRGWTWKTWDRFGEEKNQQKASWSLKLVVWFAVPVLLNSWSSHFFWNPDSNWGFGYTNSLKHRLTIGPLTDYFLEWDVELAQS